MGLCSSLTRISSEPLLSYRVCSACQVDCQVPASNMNDSSLEKANTHTSTQEAEAEHHDTLKKEDTHDDIHIHNELAFKGDDSDGKVDWTPRSIIAAMTLGALYTGELMNSRSNWWRRQPFGFFSQPSQDPRSCSTSWEEAWAISRPTSTLPPRLAGFRSRTHLRSPPSLPSLATFKIFWDAEASLCLARSLSWSELPSSAARIALVRPLLGWRSQGPALASAN